MKNTTLASFVFLATITCVWTAPADVLWNYDPDAGTLTEIVEGDAKPWVFKVTAAGSVTGMTPGDNLTIDLRQATMPEGAPTIKTWGFSTTSVNGYNYLNMDASLIPWTTVYFPEAITSFGGFAIYNWKSVETLVLPPNLTSIGDYAFERSTGINMVLPDSVTTIGANAFNSSTKLLSVKMPAKLSSCGSSNFSGCSNLREMTWPAWCGAFAGTSGNVPWSDKNCRYLVPGSNATWMATIADPSYVTYWDNVSASDQAAYYTRYGNDAAKPYGLSVSGALPGGAKATWIVVQEAKSNRAYIHVTAPSSDYGELSFEPAPDADGTWANGMEVRVSFATAEGVNILGWSGNVPTGYETAEYFTITASGTKALALTCVADNYTYSDGKLSDGSVVMTVTGNAANGYTVKKLESVGMGGLVDLTKPIDGGGKIVAVGESAFQNNTSIRRVLLPDDLTSIARYAFKGCSKLVSVEPFLPRGLTTLKYEAFSGCSSLTNGAEIGFGTNATTHLPITVNIEMLTDRNTYLFPSCKKIPYVKWGPGVVEVPRESARNMSSLTNLEYSVNTTIVREFYTTGCGNLATVTCLATNTMTFSYKGATSCFPSSVREIVWNGWYTTAGGSTQIGAWADKNCRFIVPGDNLDWLNFIASNVTPWKDLDASTQQYYYTRYGATAKEPVGLSAVVSGRHNKTWIVKTDVQLAGCMLVLPTVNAAFGTVEATPAPRASDGMYAPDTEVTVTFTPQTGVTFRRWTGDVSDEDAVKSSFTFSITEATTLGLQFDANFFHYEDGVLTDGAQKITATKAAAGYTATGVMAMSLDGQLDLSKPDTDGLGIVVIANEAFKDNTAITRLVLPDGLQSLGHNAFSGCSKIVDVENFLPRGLTWIGNASFYGCSSITNVAYIGFGTNTTDQSVIKVKMDNSSSGDRNSNLFGNCSKLPAVHYGPGVTTVERFAVYGCSKLGEIVMSVNTITNREYYSQTASITNVVCLTTNVMNFTCHNQGTFSSCGSLRQIVFNGWFNIACGGTFMTVSDKLCRFVVPGDNLDWIAFIGDGTKVQPWNDLTDAERQYYVNRYGEDDDLVPCGLTYAVGGKYNRVWVVKTKAELPGCPLTVTVPNAAFGTVTVSPAPGAGGLYEPGTEVTATFVPESGVQFRGWVGDIPAEDAQKLTVTFEINGAMTLVPSLIADFMIYENGQLTDGLQVYSASGAADAISLDSVTSTLPGGLVDLTKPIHGGTLTKIKAFFCNWCDAATKFNIRDMRLPETITDFGARSFDCCTCITNVSPLFPRDVTTVGYSIFAGASALKGNVSVGYAVDANGKPKTVTFQYTDGVNRSFINVTKIGPCVKLGPGVTKAPSGFFQRSDSITNILIEGVAKMESGVFQYMGKCDVTFTADMPTLTSTCPFTLASGKNYLQRYYLPSKGGRDFPLWSAYLKDATKVKPWTSMTAAEKALYRTKFPNAPRQAHPYGLTLTGDVLPANQWVFASVKRGMAIRIR